MKKEYTSEMRSKTRSYHEFIEPNKKGEKIAFEFIKCENSGGKNSLPYIWKKNGYIDKELKTYWSVDVFATDTAGCWGRYNTTEKISDDGKRRVLNFDWVLEATEENKQKIIDEIYKRATS